LVAEEGEVDPRRPVWVRLGSSDYQQAIEAHREHGLYVPGGGWNWHNDVSNCSHIRLGLRLLADQGSGLRVGVEPRPRQVCVLSRLVRLCRDTPHAV
jgi:hypothetical protein